MNCSIEERRAKTLKTIENKLVGKSTSVQIDSKNQKAYFYFGRKYKVKNSQQAFRHAQSKIDTVQAWIDSEYGPAFSKGWLQLGQEFRDTVTVHYKFPTYVEKAYELKEIEDDAAILEYEKMKAEELARGVTEEGEGEFYQQDDGRRTPPNKELNDRLKEILGKGGITVSNINNFQERTGVDAVGLANLGKKIILINDGKENTDTLPEETGHFAIEALVGTPLYERAMKNVEGSALYNQQVEKYRKIYNGNETKVRKEILGQIFGFALKNKFAESKDVPTTLMSLLKRLWANFLLQFRLVKASEIDKAIEMSFGKQVEKVLKGEFDFSKANSTDIMLQIDEANFKDSSLLQGFKNELKEIIKIRTALLNEFKAKGGIEFTHREQARIDELTALYNEKKITTGLIKFINQLSNESDLISDRFESLFSTMDKRSPQEVAKTLSIMNRYISAYKPIIDALKSDVRRQKNNITKAEEILDELRIVSENIDNMAYRYNTVGIGLLADVLEPFAKENPNYNRKAFEKSLTLAEKDITWTRRFLDSMAESSDNVLQVLDRYVKEEKEAARLQTDAEIRELMKADEALKAAGVRDTEWMAERDKDGNLTGYFIQEYNMGEYERERYIFYLSLLKKYDLSTDIAERNKKLDANPKIAKAYDKDWQMWFKQNNKDHPDIENIIIAAEKRFMDFFVVEKYDEKIIAKQTRKAKEAFEDWKAENIAEKFDVTTGELDFVFKRELSVPADKYKSKEFQDLHLPQNKAKLDYYNTIMRMKAEKDGQLPSTLIQNNLMPQVLKDWMERAKSGDLKENLKTITEAYTRTADEVEYGNTFKLTNVEGHKVNMLPIHFTKKLDKMVDLSLDTTSTMALYIKMANNYHHMNKIVDILEIGKDILSKRKVPTGESNILGKANELFTGDPILQELTGGKAFERYKDYLDMVVYGKMKADEGTLKIFGQHVDAAKLVDLFNKYTSVKGLALNVYAGLANPILGNALIKQEAMAREYVEAEDIAYADKTYWSQLSGLIGEIGKPVSINKLRLFIEKADVLQDFEHRTLELNLDRGRFGRLMNVSSLFFMNSMGEHQMQVRMALAIANTIKLKKDGEDTTLYEAMTVDEDKADITYDGLTKMDGTPFTQKDFIAYTLKVKGVNQRLHGIYNEIDRAALQKWSLGRFALMFRKFMKPGFNRRYEKRKFNYQINAEVEGSYRSFARFIKQLYVENKLLQFHYKKEFENLSPMKKANVRRTITELSYLMAALTLSGILTSFADDDPDNWLLNMAAYQANRLYTEIGFYVPPFAGQAAIKVLQSPAAGVDQLETLVNYYKTFDIFGAIFEGEPLIREIKSGKNKGQTFFWVNTKRAVPIVGTMEKAMTPEEQLQFFKK